MPKRLRAADRVPEEVMGKLELEDKEVLASRRQSPCGELRQGMCLGCGL